MNTKVLNTLLFFLPYFATAQSIEMPPQPTTGPGGSAYVYTDIKTTDRSEKAEGYWLYEPDAPELEQAPLVVFVHGYGAMNPMIYGAWIKHLVRKGNIVLFPRYQKNLVSPSPKHFVDHVATAIRDALVELDSGQHIRPLLENFALVGHSYGGVIAANLSVNFANLGVPQARSVMLCSPGSGPFSGGVLKSYEGIPVETNLLVMVNDKDRVVGDKIGMRVFETAKQVTNRNLIRQYTDRNGSQKITAGHNECYAVDRSLDSGNRNPSTRRALRVGKINTLDYRGYWKLFDALLDYTREGKNGHYAFGNTPEQCSLGEWSDGTPVRSLKVLVPEKRAVSLK